MTRNPENGGSVLERLPWPALGRWWAVGLLFYVIGMVLLYVFEDLLRVPLFAGTLATAELTLLARFGLNDRWVFRRSDSAWKRLWQYHVACAGGSAIWWGVTNGAAALGLHYLLASTAGCGCSVLFSMASNFLWVWRRNPAKEPAQ